MKRRTLLQAALASTALGTSSLHAQAWPSKPIKYVVPFPAGGTTDILARIIGPKLSAALGTPVLVDNRPGAGGVLGSDLVAKSAPDGYTILGSTISTHAINPALNPKMPYDAAKDFTGITLIGSVANAVIVPANSPFKTLKELIDFGRANPGKLSYSSAGNGTSQHMSGEMFKLMAKVFAVHIPYRGSAPAIQDVIGGQLSMGFDTIVVAAPHIKAGTVRALAVTSARRVKGFENIPTIAESGVPGFDVASWQAVHAPAGTPPEIVARLASEIAKAIEMPDVRARLDGLGLEPSGMPPAQFADFNRKELAKWANVVKSAGLKME
ncbi:MAG: tripartite tricarboxylate transporter substrate binding protein [Gammaproteobacteria bacterium]|nr:tripartite tricarboxylate transporter substrate binding protein [Gammaproteobacteria bacterium]MBU0788857.1 tripartite tricarboxylate transporter substrate binding protein [Gammaproteobacteria bacterium]MBU0817191.1 tripartite tricarboxylate transporter substrate binding protein [Gammaproteobacteria bacterium]MBU1787301.1 tripartite tricarboxylate transporter substrate binding protein [Gammaproteobacteria bacterium]